MSKHIEITTAENSGFCIGVRKAVELLNAEIELSKKNNSRIYMLGKIIHNGSFSLMVSASRSLFSRRIRSISSCVGIIVSSLYSKVVLSENKPHCSILFQHLNQILFLLRWTRGVVERLHALQLAVGVEKRE